MVAADIARTVILMMAVMLIIIIAATIRTYYKASRIAIAKGDSRGILAAHVWLVGVFTIGLIASTAYQNVVQYGQPPSLYLLSNGVLYPVGLVALWLILRFEDRRIHGPAVTDVSLAGVPGPPGPPGEKGDKGDYGETGVRGKQGERGLSVQGVQGFQGVQGVQGVSGGENGEGEGESESEDRSEE